MTLSRRTARRQKSDERNVLPLESASSSLSSFSQAGDPISTPRISAPDLRHSLSNRLTSRAQSGKICHLPQLTLHMSVATFPNILTWNTIITAIILASFLCRGCAYSALVCYVCLNVGAHSYITYVAIVMFMRVFNIDTIPLVQGYSRHALPVRGFALTSILDPSCRGRLDPDPGCLWDLGACLNPRAIA